MEFWLSQGSQRLQLPVPPSSFELDTGNNNTVVVVTEFGEVNLLGKEKLSALTLESFFPSQEYSFCQYTGFPSPYDCCRMIDKWKFSGKPIRVLITGTDINLAMSIEAFNFGEQDGSGDVYFHLEFKEYYNLTVPTLAITAAGASTASATTAARPTKAPQKVYTVKSGDTLLKIAKKATGSTANAAAIAKKNSLANPQKIRVGQILLTSW